MTTTADAHDGDLASFDFRNPAPDYAWDPFGATSDLRVGHAVWSTTWGGFWILTNAEDVRACLQNSTLFSSSGGFGIPAREKDRPIIPLELDPPEHAKYRQVLAPFFGPGSVNRLWPSLSEAAAVMVDEFAQDGHCEFMAQFAQRFPTRAMVAMLGLPVDDTPELVRWNHEFLHFRSIENPVGTELEAAQRIERYLAAAIRSRSVQPRDDLISQLVAAEVDGRPITADEVMSLVFQLFIAGLDTVTAVLGRSFLYLAERPQLQAALQDPALLDGAVEELLRMFPIALVTRTATSDVDFGGVHIRKGERILIDFDFWNRDSTEFERPDECNYSRQHNRHLSFGAGRHRCLGSHLARVELAVALKEFVARVPRFRLAGDAAPTPYADLVRGVTALPLAWDVP
jgi:cytochrome P450